MIPKLDDTPTVWAAFRDAPLAVKTLLAGVFITGLVGFLNIFLVLYLIASGHDVQRATIALGVHGAGAMVGVLLGGMLAKPLGARYATVLGKGVTGLGIISLLFLSSYGSLLVAVFLVGVMSRIARPAAATLMSDLTPASGQIMIAAMSRFAFNVGVTSAPMLGYALFHLGHDRFDILFWAEGLAVASYAAIAWFALPSRTSEAAPAAKEVASAGGYAAVLRDRPYVLYLFAMLAHTVVYVQYQSTLPLDVTAHSVPIFWYTVAITLNGFIVIALELLLTRVTQRWASHVTIGLSFSFTGLGVACYGLPMVPAFIVLGTLVWTVGEVIGGPAIFAYPATAGPAHLKPWYLGSFQFVFGAGCAIGPVVGGWLLAHVGHRVWFFLACASVCATLAAQVATRSRLSRGRPVERPCPCPSPFPSLSEQ